MNRNCYNLYQRLLKLVESNKAFYYKDHEIEGHIYRLFNYHYASPKDFPDKESLESRGITFLVDKNGEFLDIVSRPIEKFFNYGEIEEHKNIDINKNRYIFDKLDGSLISTYLHKNKLMLKSKGSFDNNQIRIAYELVKSDKRLYDSLIYLEKNDYTVNMELCGPDNIIVIPYQENKLYVLNVRHRYTGEYLDYEEIVYIFGEDRVVKKLDVPDLKEFYEYMKREDIDLFEGLVVWLEDGTKLKLKTYKYLKLHGVLSNFDVKKIREMTINNEIDDILTFIRLHYNNTEYVKKIEEEVEDTKEIINHTIDKLEKYYQENKHLDKKLFALKAMGELPKHEFGYVMNLYNNKKFSISEFFMKNYDKYFT